MKEITEIIKMIGDIGLITVIAVIFIYFIFKYAPKYIELKLKRMEEKNYMLDSFKSVVENNSQVISNNSRVIDLNSKTIKNYTDNAYKLENKVEELTKELHDTNKNIEIIKERGK